MESSNLSISSNLSMTTVAEMSAKTIASCPDHKVFREMMEAVGQILLAELGGYENHESIVQLKKALDARLENITFPTDDQVEVKLNRHRSMLDDDDDVDKMYRAWIEAEPNIRKYQKARDCNVSLTEAFAMLKLELMKKQFPNMELPSSIEEIMDREVDRSVPKIPRINTIDNMSKVLMELLAKDVNMTERVTAMAASKCVPSTEGASASSAVGNVDMLMVSSLIPDVVEMSVSKKQEITVPGGTVIVLPNGKQIHIPKGARITCEEDTCMKEVELLKENL